MNGVEIVQSMQVMFVAHLRLVATHFQQWRFLCAE